MGTTLVSDDLINTTIDTDREDRNLEKFKFHSNAEVTVLLKSQGLLRATYTDNVSTGLNL